MQALGNEPLGLKATPPQNDVDLSRCK